MIVLDVWLSENGSIFVLFFSIASAVLFSEGTVFFSHKHQLNLNFSETNRAVFFCLGTHSRIHVLTCGGYVLIFYSFSSPIFLFLKQLEDG
jgi:hypothetical protein